MITKETILAAIDRTARSNGGRALGRDAFQRETGIRESDWLGRYWTKWSDVLVEAGYEANSMTVRLEDELVLDALIGAIRELGKFPTYAELKLRRRTDPTFPSHGTIAARGTKAELAGQIARLLDLRQDNDPQVREALALVQTKGPNEPERPTEEELDGAVYMLQVGKHYKIGRTNAFGRRERELAIQMPERASTVHVISTDDPVGIEAYWHRRFADRRVRRDAEWFLLKPADVSAFRRRKFQ